jgi:hypothetical protein
MRHAHLPCDLGWSDALLEHIRSPHPPLLHGRKIASRPDTPQRPPARALLYRNTAHARCRTNHNLTGSTLFRNGR